ncbi:O-antigen polysaccharide polymerase Wzy [Guggenheimella bovis]
MENKRIPTILSAVTIGLAILLTIVALVLKNFNLHIVSLLLVTLFLFLESLREFEKRVVLFFFTISIAIFLVSRPSIDLFTGFAFLRGLHYNPVNGTKAILLIELSLVSMYIGQVAFERFFTKKETLTTLKPQWMEENKTNLFRFLLLFFAIGFLCYSAENVEKVLFRRTHSYFELYSSFKTTLPFVVTGFARTFFASFVTAYALSEKRRTKIILVALYLFSNAIGLLAGLRAPFAKALFFVFVVLFIEVANDKRNGEMLKKLVLWGVIFLTVVTPLFLYIDSVRFGVRPKKLMITPVQLVYDQGISFTTITRGVDFTEHRLAKRKNYSFGPLIDKFDPNLKGVNPYSMDMVELGNSYAADIAYHLYGPRFVNGLGIGSNHIIEIYMDFRSIGVMIYSVFLGLLLGLLSKDHRNLFVKVASFIMLSELFYIPRAQALRFIFLLLEPQNWLPLVAAIGLTMILKLGGKREHPAHQ